MITPDANPATATKSAHSCLGVSLASLAADGTPPAAGDTVEFQAKATISRIEGEKAYVTVTEANGEPVTIDDGDGKDAEDMTDDDMMEMARKADEQGDMES